MEKLEADYRTLVESGMPFLKVYPDFIVGNKGKRTKNNLKMQNFKRSLLLTCGINF